MKHRCTRMLPLAAPDLCGKKATLFYVVYGVPEAAGRSVPIARCEEHKIVPDGEKWAVSMEIYEVACVMES